MKKVLRIFLSLSSMATSGLISLTSIACTSSIDDPYAAIYQKFFNWDSDNPYYDFLNQANQVLSNNVSNEENQKFNHLYDDGTADKTWNTEAALETALTTTKLSDTVTLNVDWENMYNQVGLSMIDKSMALTQQLRFYNILAHLYQSDNVLKLVQWVRLASQQQGNIVAYNEYYPGVNSQTQTFGPIFANMAVINEQYVEKFWSSDEITSVSTHESGHALSNFITATPLQRKRFNTTYIDIHSYNNYHNVKNLTETNFNDGTEILINFIDQDAAKQGIITLDNKIEKFFLALLIFNTRYSQSAWINDNINERDEFFAESFAYWILTPQSQRNVGWGLLNDFFVDYVPTLL